MTHKWQRPGGRHNPRAAKINIEPNNSGIRRRRLQPLPTAAELLVELEAEVRREWGSDLSAYGFCPDFPAVVVDRSGGEDAHGPERLALAAVLYIRWLRDQRASVLRDREVKARRRALRIVAGGR